MNRREFMALACALAAGCAMQSPSEQTFTAVPPTDAGPAADYANDGIYDRFASQGFFIIRRGSRLSVISSFCTHRHYPLKAEPDHCFYCKGHGSTFDPDGKVTHGPATVDLPIFRAHIDQRGHLIVQTMA